MHFQLHALLHREHLLVLIPQQLGAFHGHHHRLQLLRTMENQNQPTSEATPATHNPMADAEAFAVINGILDEAFENNRERAKFADVYENATDVKEERDALNRLAVWLAASEAKGDAPDLSAVPVDALISEIYRRHHKGECVALVITPDDVSEYWECDDSGATSPASRVPENGEEMKALRYAFDHWLDRGGYTEVMQTLRDAWNDEQARQLDAQESKGDAK